MTKELKIFSLGCHDSIKFIQESNKALPIKNRIRFCDLRSLGSLGEGQEFYSFLCDGDKIIGVAHVGYYSINAKNEKNWSISYLSIDKNFRNKGYSKLLVDEVFRNAKILNLEISTSSYTFLGKKYLQKNFNDSAKKHEVVFYDKPDDWYLIDAESHYLLQENGVYFHKDEL